MNKYLKCVFLMSLVLVLTSASSNNGCPDNAGFVIIIPNPNNCSQYIVCDNGIFTIYDCPPGLKFNPEIKACDFPENVDCEETDVPFNPQIKLLDCYKLISSNPGEGQTISDLIPELFCNGDGTCMPVKIYRGSSPGKCYK